MPPRPVSDLLPAPAVFVFTASVRPSMNPHRVGLGWSSTSRDSRLSGCEWADPSAQTQIIFGPTLSANMAGETTTPPPTPPARSQPKKRRQEEVTESHDHQSRRNTKGQSVAVASEALHVTWGSGSNKPLEERPSIFDL